MSVLEQTIVQLPQTSLQQKQLLSLAKNRLLVLTEAEGFYSIEFTAVITRLFRSIKCEQLAMTFPLLLQQHTKFQ